MVARRINGGTAVMNILQLLYMFFRMEDSIIHLAESNV